MEEELGLFDLLYIMGDTLQFNKLFSCWRKWMFQIKYWRSRNPDRINEYIGRSAVNTVFVIGGVLAN